MMKAFEVKKEKWVFKLAPQLTGKAQQAFTAMNPENTADYSEVKKAILRRYNIREETYRQRFRTAKKDQRQEAHNQRRSRKTGRQLYPFPSTRVQGAIKGDKSIQQ